MHFSNQCPKLMEGTCIYLWQKNVNIYMRKIKHRGLILNMRHELNVTLGLIQLQENA